MRRYKAYGEYKDSGVDRLGTIPLHWEYVRLKYAANLVGDKVGAGTNLKYVGLENIESGNGKYKEKEEVVPEGQATSFVTGNVLFGKLRPYLAKSWLADFSGICSSEFLVFESRKVSARFLNYYTLTDEFIKQVDSSTYGSKMPRASWDFIGLLDVPVPLNESEKIANFLDHEIAKIDTLIAKQQELIKLLKEKRQAVISHAVTKGINPNVPMRASGVEWLGEVPTHWAVCSVKHVSSFITSGPRGWSDYLSEDGKEIFLQSGDLNNKLGLSLDTAKRISPPGNAEGIRTKLEFGDVVVCITGANTGRVAIAPELDAPVYINQHLSLIRTIQSKVNSNFIAVTLSGNSVRAYFSVKQYGLKEGLSLTNIAEAPVCIPPLIEQIEILDFVTRISSSLDELEKNAEWQVALLQERRTALISAAVTGKIDVRDWQAPSQPAPTCSDPMEGQPA